MPEDHFDTLNLQYCIVRTYQTLGRPEDGIPLLVDALEKGEKAGLLAKTIQRWKTCLVSPPRAILEPVTFHLQSKVVRDLVAINAGNTDSKTIGRIAGHGGRTAFATNQGIVRCWKEGTYGRERGQTLAEEHNPTNVMFVCSLSLGEHPFL